MSADPHIAALLALLNGHVHLTARVHRETVPDGTAPPYVKVYFHVHYMDHDQLTNPSTRAVARVISHSIGSTAEAADVVAGNVREALLGITPTVSGRTCFPVRQEQSIPPDSDESTGQPAYWDQIDVYRLDTVPG